MDENQTNADIVRKENRKEFRQICIIAFIIFAIIIVRNISHQYNLKEIDKAAADLLADSKETRLAAVKTLREFDETEAKAALLTAFKDKDGDIRAQAATALYGWKDERALTALLSAIKDKDGDVRYSAASSLKYFVGAGMSAPEVTQQQKESAASALDKAFKAKDYPVIAGAVVYFIEKGENGTEPVLISALKACGSKSMAEIYLNCGNAELEFAAEQWAKNHNYRIEIWRGQQPIAVGAAWGSKSKK